LRGFCVVVTIETATETIAMVSPTEIVLIAWTS